MSELFKYLLGILLSFTVMQGCATTRVVKKQPGKGGEIMVQEGLFGDARGDADKKMRANCGGKRVEVTEEGEAVVGSRTSFEGEKEGKRTHGSARTEDEREWRIKYRCLKKA